MGRGRAKAKQTKVARDLKYRTFNTDFSSLERELRGTSPYETHQPDADEYEDDDGEDDYRSYGRTS
ncbi:MAG: DUF3073 domain-containing protein [Nigerium sp.]|nr:DUF3073 domain-containing protein [Nigerium sp.]